MTRRIVIGDIHGCYFTLKALMENKVKPSRKDQIYFVGDLIDRGPRTKDVLDYVIQLKSRGYQIYPVRGNHEEMFIKAIGDESFLKAWYANGAEDTLRSFDIPEKLIADLDVFNNIPDTYIHFIMALPYYYDLSDYVIVHAGINFNSEDIFGDVMALLWSRKMDYQANKIHNKTIIHGHTPMPLVSIKPNVSKPGIKTLNIDAGCVYKDLPGYGILAALDLDTRELFSQVNID
jgi:serine/threonine protein phosphatase 1